MKCIPLFACICIFSWSAAAQQKLELRMSTGYGFSVTRNNPGIIDKVNANSTNPGMGRGLRFGADATWWLGKVFGVVAGANYNITVPPLTTTDKRDSPFDLYSYKNSWQSHIALAFAGIALRIPGTKINPYARIGLLLPVDALVTQKTNWRSQTGNEYGSSTRLFRPGNTAGYSMSMGIAPRLNNRLALLAAINIETINVTARRSTYTSIIYNGMDRLSTYPASYLETLYVKNPQSYTANQPSQQPTFAFPYSSIGLDLGIAIKL